jgi:hypothetical protein
MKCDLMRRCRSARFEGIIRRILRNASMMGVGAFFPCGGFILRDGRFAASSQDEVLDFLLGRRSKTLMVRSAATPRVSNHVAVG